MCSLGPDGSCSSAEALRGTQLRSLRSPPTFPWGRRRALRAEAGLRLLPAMLLLCVSAVVASALAAPAPGASGQRRGIARAWPDAPNVVLVVSDSFVSTESGAGRARRSGSATRAQPFPCPGFGEHSLTLANLFHSDAKQKVHCILKPHIHTYTT